MALEEKEKELARRRMLKGKPSENFTEGEPGEALEKVARAVGWSRCTYGRAKKVVEVAREDPGRYEDLLGTMEEVSVLAAHGKRLRCRELEGRERGAGQAGDGREGDRQEGAENILGKIFPKTRAEP
jgi:hypothetical protein